MTDVYFSFDTEDFTSDHAADAIRDEAELMRECGVRANFNIVGYLARMLVRNRRFDVLDALKPHTISFHSLRHSFHPTICEYTDVESYEDARAEFMRQENEGIGMVRAVSESELLPCACPPGNSLSYVAMYGYADLGIPLYIGSLFKTPDGAGVYFCNQLHLNYDYAAENLFFKKDWNVREFLDRAAGMRRLVIYNHPNMVLYSEFWDMVNYNGENKHPMGEWEEAPRRSEADKEHYMHCLRELTEAIKADGRFRIGCIEELLKTDEREVRKEMLPAIRSALKQKLHSVAAPVSLSVAECFAAAAHFLFSDEPFHPGKSYGFLEEPKGTAVPLTLSAQEVRTLAASWDPAAFLPTEFEINGKRIGPADLLFAMLDVACGAAETEVVPRKQQCGYSEYPNLSKLSLKNSWIHSKDFEDRYLSDRLRLQAWTLRGEV